MTHSHTHESNKRFAHRTNLARDGKWNEKKKMKQRKKMDDFNFSMIVFDATVQIGWMNRFPIVADATTHRCNCTRRLHNIKYIVTKCSVDSKWHCRKCVKINTRPEPTANGFYLPCAAFSVYSGIKLQRPNTHFPLFVIPLNANDKAIWWVCVQMHANSRIRVENNCIPFQAMCE